MTLQELKTRCENNHIPYYYGNNNFGNTDLLKPPYLIAHTNSSTNFIADGIVYKKIRTIQLDFYYDEKDFEKQNVIENNILYDVAWDKDDESYFDGEEIWQVSYYFEIVGEINEQ